jgi:(S)-ureidoglycine aminohydrolase
MKIIILTTLTILSVNASFAQKDTLHPGVYHWADLNMQKDSSRDRAQVLDGGTWDLDNLEIHVSTLDPGKAPHPPHKHADTEEMVIIKKGTLKVTIKGVTRLLGPGSIAFAIPGDEHGFENGGKTKAAYYVLKFKSKSPMDVDRAKKAGGSFMIDWNELKATKTDRGERRNVFERPTSQFTRFEMHITDLNAGQVSHAPHNHIQEEIILLSKGKAQMQVGSKFYPFAPGDLVFLNTGVLHALKNTGSEPCEYFAFTFH